MINPGLAPWAMREYRPCRALRRLPPQLLSFIALMRLPLFLSLESFLGYSSIYYFYYTFVGM